jgi:prevent-host-death family protein
MHTTYARPSSDLRNNYAELVRLIHDHDRVIITNNGRGEAVLISIEDYQAYERFLHEQYVKSELEEVWGDIKEKYGI